MRQRNAAQFVYADLVAAVALALVAGLSVVPGLLDAQPAWLSGLRFAVVGPFLLFVPGYAFVAALFPGDAEISVLERTVFSLGASLALVALVGIGLDQLPPGVTVATVVASQVTLVVVLTTLAAIRRRRGSVDSIGYLDIMRRAWEGRNAIGGGHRVLQVALVVAVLLTVGATAYAATQPLPSERYSELSLVGPDGTVDGVPETASPDELVNLTVGVHSQEHRTSSMGLQAQLVRPDGDRRVLFTRSSELSHNETEEFLVSIQVPSVDAGSRVKLEVLLFQGDAPGSAVPPERAYRSVYTWITVEETDGTSSNTNQTSETA